MDMLFISIFVYYDVIVIVAFLSFIIIRYFYYHVCLFVWFQSASKTNEPANSLTVLRINRGKEKLTKLNLSICLNELKCSRGYRITYLAPQGS